MKDQLCNLHWEVNVFVRSLEGLRIPITTSAAFGERGSVCESSKFYIYGIKEDNVYVTDEGSRVTIQVTKARIHMAEISWEIREDWAPNISTAGYVDATVLQSNLSFKILLEINRDPSTGILDLRLNNVDTELVQWDAAIKHYRDQMYNKYSGLSSDGRIKKAIEGAFAKQVVKQFSEKIQAKREAARRNSGSATAIVPDPAKVCV